MKKILNFLGNKRPGWEKTIRIMKLSMFLMVVFTTVATASTYSQSTKLKLKMEEATIVEIFREIEETSEFGFFFKSDDLDTEKRYSIDLNDVTVEEVLNRILKEEGVDYRIENKNVIITKAAADVDIIQQAKRTITGKVTDENGESLPGVAVVVRGTTIGAITDIDGSYSLAIPDDAQVIVYSFVGMETQEVNVAGKNTIDVTLKADYIGLGEVIAVGYGVQKKADLTGSVSAVKGDALMKAPVPNLEAALVGKVTGVLTMQNSGQPGYENTTFRIRGASTSGNNDPLVIVDGVERPFSRIDPNEIESVSVLKDAASTAVYGARAANGILLITTKRGATGKPVFEYTGSYGTQSLTRQAPMMNAYEYAKYINEAKANYGEDLLFDEAEIEQFRTGERPSYDWLGFVLDNNAPTQKQNFSVRGGTDKTKYFVSFGYLDQEGLYKASSYDQYSVRSNLDVALTDRLDFGIDLAARIQDRMGSSSGIGNIFSSAMFSRPYLNPAPVEETGDPEALGNNGTGGNPKGIAERQGYRGDLDRIIQSNFTMKYRIPGIEGLTAKGLYSYDYTSKQRKDFTHPFTVYEFVESTGDYNKVQAGPSTTKLSERRDNIQRSTLQLSLDYAKQIGDHNISALALFEQVENKNDWLSANRDDFISTLLDEMYAGGLDKMQNDGKSATARRRGYVGRIGYDYQGRYLLQANMRIDESYIFMEGHRAGYFPAFSAGWRISEEKFMENQSLFSNLKLRGSWGKVGNDRVDPFQYLSAYSFAGGTVIGGSFHQGIQEDVLPNPFITWEKATSSNIGVDMGFFDNKLGFEADYFYKSTTDILIDNDGVIPQSFGASGLPDENLGIVDSWGTEFLLSYNNRFGDLIVSADANLTWTNNKWVHTSEAADIVPGMSKIGRAMGLRYGYLSDGLFQTEEEIAESPLWFNQNKHNKLKPGDIRYRDINGRNEDGTFTGEPDGVVNADDRTVISKPEFPGLIFGFNLGLDYKGFDLTANFQGASDYSRYIQPISFQRDGNNFARMVDSWRPGNEDAEYPRLASGDKPSNLSYDSDFWVTDITYLRLRNLEIGYNLGILKSTFNGIGIDNVRIFAAGTNLMTISNLEWRDPEQGSSGYAGYPQVKTVSFGVNVKF